MVQNYSIIIKTYEKTYKSILNTLGGFASNKTWEYTDANYNKLLNFYKIAFKTFQNAINFVDRGGKKKLNAKYMSIGRKKGGDAHKEEDKYLQNAGWVINKNKRWTLEKPQIKTNNYINTANKLLLFTKQRCMRHEYYGHKDLNNESNLNRHRKPILNFIKGIENLILQYKKLRCD